MGTRGKWVVGALAVVGLSAAIWIGLSEATVQHLPWETSDGVAAQILAEASAVAPAQDGAAPIAALAPGAATGAPALQANTAPSAIATNQPQRASGDNTIAPRATAGAPAATSAPAATQPVVLRHGQVQEGSLSSTIMGADMPYLIYLPPGYDDAANANTRYPVVYMLHGAPGGYRDWVDAAGADKTADALISTGRIPPMILVMPEGHCSPLGDSEWSDGTPPAQQAESYLVREVVPYIDAHYRTIAERGDRAIGGLSTGGYAGVNMLFHHSDLFSTAWSLSGNYTAPDTLLGQPLFRTPESVAANTPLQEAAKLANPSSVHVYLDVGKSDSADNTNVETQQMEQALIAAHIPHQVNYFDGSHSWSYWATHLVNALEYISANLPS